jgi:membrane protein implicated in regulation of membrane protease activity
VEQLTGIEAHWLWVGLGLILATAEMVVPGVYLLWIAIAAIATGLLTFAFDLSGAMQIVQFSFLTLIAVYSARRFLRDTPIRSSDPLLNNRVGRLVGEIGVVSAAIEDGQGRIHLGDSDWSARGPDLGTGTKVRVTGHEGTALVVEPLPLAEGEAPAPPALGP